MRANLLIFAIFSLLTTSCGSTGWKELTPASHPSANGGGAAVYDTQRQVGVFLGGFLNETWLWDNGTWVKVISQHQPPPRSKFGMAYDEARNKVVIFGGVYDTTLYNDTWEWDGIDWVKIETEHAPPPRCCHAIAYDPSNAQIVLYGGWDPRTNLFLDDVWLWDGYDWTELENQEVPIMSGHKMATLSSQILATLTSGQGTWIWNGQGWENLNLDSPPDRPDSVLTYDSK
jgi:hypothetical protein